MIVNSPKILVFVCCVYFQNPSTDSLNYKQYNTRKQNRVDCFLAKTRYTVKLKLNFNPLTHVSD